MDVQGIVISNSRELGSSVWADIDARGWTVTLCVSDVSSAISKGSVYDETAKRRVETVPLEGGGNRPLLPRRFCEAACALVEDLPRPVMAMRIRLDHDMGTRSFVVDRSTLIAKNMRLSDPAKILTDEDHSLHRPVLLLSRLASLLMAKRAKHGAFAFSDRDLSIVSDEDGSLISVDPTEFDGRAIVQEIGILANSELARFCVENNLPVPFRNQTARASAPDRQSMLERISLGILGRASDLESAKEHVSLVLNRAQYEAVTEGHYGTRLPAYVHATNPASRYADLVTQRQVMASVDRVTVPYTWDEIDSISKHINESVAARIEAAEVVRRDRAEVLTGGDLAHLSDKEFDRAIAAASAGSFNPFVADAFIKKMKIGKASIASMRAILVSGSESWKPVKLEVIRHLKEFPHRAASIVAMARQVDGWSGPAFKEERGGESGRIKHSVTVRVEKPGMESDKISASTLRVARQLAIVNLLEKLND